MSFAELDRRANRLARYLRRTGLRRGDTVAILMENNEHVHTAMWAARRSGLYFTLINTHLGPTEIAYIVDDCAAKAIISSRLMRSVCEELVEHLPRGLPPVALMANDDLPGGQGIPAACRRSLKRR